MKNETLLEKLGRLSAVRTVRTDQLHTAVRALCEQLDELALTGDNVTIPGGYSLRDVEYKSNVGTVRFWQFGYPVDTGAGWETGSCALVKSVDSEGYVHGDFNCPITGPTRGALIAFAQHAQELVAALVRNAERSIERLDAGLASVAAASEQLETPGGRRSAGPAAIGTGERPAEPAILGE